MFKITFLSRLSNLFIVSLFFLILPQINKVQYVSSTITSKFVYFIFGCIVLFVFCVFKLVYSNEKTFSLTYLDMALTLLLIYITCNRYIIQQNYGFSIRYFELLGLILFYISVRLISVKHCYWLSLSIIVSGLVQALYGIFQFLGYYSSNHTGFRMTGSFFNPGPYAGFLVTVWIIALGFYLFRDEIKKQILSKINSEELFVNYLFEYIPLLGIVVIALVLPVLESRASWVAALLSSTILLEFRYCYLRKLFKKTTIKSKKAIVILLITGILATIFFKLYDYKKDSSDGRMLIWKVSTGIITDNPFFGVGFDRFATEYMNYQARYFSAAVETNKEVLGDNTNYAFNEGLQFLIENGIVGFLFLIPIIIILWRIKADKKTEIPVLIAKMGILSIATFACFSYSMQILPIKLMLFFFLALLSNSTGNSFRFKIIEFRAFKRIYKNICLLFACFLVYQGILYAKKLNENFLLWGAALQSYQFGDYKQASLEYERAYPMLNKNGEFLMNYGKTLAMNGDYYNAILILGEAKQYLNNTVIAIALGDSYKKTHQYEKAESAYIQASNMIPARFYALYLLANLYDESGQQYKAFVLARKILDKNIKVPSKAIEEIRSEMEKILVKYKKSSGYKKIKESQNV